MNNMIRFVSDALFDAFAFMAPLAPAAIGALATEYVGSLNIALEGLILAGAFTYVATGFVFGPVAGVLVALGATALLAFGADLFSRKAQADSFVVGLGVNMMVPALASILSLYLFGTKGVVVLPEIQTARLFAAARVIPGIGWIFGHHAMDYAALAVAASLALVIARTRFGLRVRAAGMSSESLRMAGLDVGSIRGAAYAISGLACGAAGIALAASVGSWVPNMSAGRGWIALVAVYLGGKNLAGTVAASAFFAILLSLATRAQAVENAPPELLMALPYFAATVVVIAGAFRRAKKT